MSVCACMYIDVYDICESTCKKHCFPNWTKCSKEGTMSLFSSTQAGYLFITIESGRKFVMQALTLMPATGIEFDCITTNTALHFHRILRRVEVEKQ